MMIAEPENRPFVDRTEEIELFTDLLRCAGQLRILAISEEGEHGKTELLRKMRSCCEPPVRVSLVDAKRVVEPLDFLMRVRRDLGDGGLEFPAFDQQLSRYYDLAPPQSVTVNMQGANLLGAHDFSIKGAENNAPSPGFTEHSRLIRDGVYRTFFDELQQHCRKETVVVLVDTFDSWRETVVHEWFHRPFMYRLFFGNEPARLLLIVAGRSLPAFDEFSESMVAARVQRRRLGAWSEPDVIEYFRRRTGREPNKDDLGILRGVANKQLPAGRVAAIVDVLVSAAVRG
jgi:hypothetical protein